MYVDVNMKKCGFKSTPKIFSTESGISSHWVDTGANSHYNPTSKTFRVYVTSSYGYRYRFQYRLNWCALGRKNRKALRRERRARRKNVGLSTCCGEAPAHGWRVYSSAGHIYQDMDTSKCGFVKTPKVFTSLSGLSSHWVLRGVSATYSNSPASFRTYIYGTNVGIARQYNYRLSWCATGLAKKQYRKGIKVIDRANRVASRRGRICCGTTRPNWQNYWVVGMTANIDTSKCKFSNRVRYFGALSGSSNHWMTTGADAIYSTAPNSFRTYIYSYGWTIRADHARQFNYSYDWCGVDY